MNNIIRTYLERKLKALDEKKDNDIIAIKTTDVNYATLRNLKKTDKKCEGLITLGEFKFSDAIKDQINEVRKAYNADVKALYALCEEADALLDTFGYSYDRTDANATKTYKAMLKLLKDFDIVKRDGTINA